MTLALSITEFENEVLQASEEELLQLIGKIPASDKDDIFKEKLIQLHNNKQIDIVNLFLKLKQKPSGGTNFFQKRRVFENILPKLDTEISQVMDCILYLVKEAGQDMAAGAIMKPFIDYCSADQSRPLTGLKVIEDSPEAYAGLLMQVLMAGSQVDFDYYFSAALRLINSDTPAVSRNAMLALGRIDYPDNASLTTQAFVALETRCNEETDDVTLANLVNAISGLYEREPSLEPLFVQAIDTALLKGNDLSLHMASELFGFRCDELTESIISVLLKHLQNVNPASRGTLDNIDYGIKALLKAGKRDQALRFLEQILLNSEGRISISIFDSVCHTILENKDGILFRIVTRWLLNGKQPLCKAVSDIVRLPHGADPILSIDLSEIELADTNQAYFLARKAIGYLFNDPVSAASIIISLIESSPPSEMLRTLAKLLFNPLLISYPGKVGDYLNQRIASIAPGEAKEALQSAEQALEGYMAELKDVGAVPEFQPSQRNRDAYSRKFQQEISEAMEQAEKNSVLLSIMPKSILLYGHKSIDYVFNRDGEARRVENPLKRIGNEVELPRLSTLDPQGLSYILAVFRAEQLNKNETNY